MTYAMAAGFQTAVYQHLLADAGVQAAVGTAVYDALPTGTLPDLYVTLGAEEALDRSDSSGAGALHRFTVTIRAENAGFSQAKTAAAAICDALLAADLTLNRGRVVGLWFDRARAERMSDGTRRISLRFTARLDGGSGA